MGQEVVVPEKSVKGKQTPFNHLQSKLKIKSAQ